LRLQKVLGRIQVASRDTFSYAESSALEDVQQEREVAFHGEEEEVHRSQRMRALQFAGMTYALSPCGEYKLESDSEPEDEELLRKKKSKAIDVFTPAGQGNRNNCRTDQSTNATARLQTSRQKYESEHSAMVENEDRSRLTYVMHI
jgi:hypothetical protein